MMPPREIPTRDSRYMGQALMLAAFSKDPSTQIGAVIVDKDNNPLGTGYNAPGSDIDDNSIDWTSMIDGSELSKHDFVIHAEINAIKNSRRRNLNGCTLYVTAFPCKYCAIDILESKISKIVYLDFRSHANSILQGLHRERSEKIFAKSKRKIEICKFEDDLTWLERHLQHLRNKGIL